MAQNDNSRMIILFIAGLFVIALAMIAALFVSTRRPIIVVVPGLGDGTGVAQATPGAAGGGADSTNGSGAAAPAAMALTRSSAIPTIDDPLDSGWDQIPAVEIPLEMQQTAEPILAKQTISKVRLQMAHDDSRYVWRLSWDQKEPSTQSNVSQFSDAVALQFPLKDGAPYTMGGPGMPVAMMYWKALWQKDVDEGFQDVTDVYPNSWADFYWAGDEKKVPEEVAKAFPKETACPYMAGTAVGNPMARQDRKHAGEELRAYGFGSSTDVPDSPVAARGVWKDGRWYVVFERPNSPSDPLIQRFQENPEQQLIALAVWDGNAQNRGGRKHITNWLPMRVEP